MKTTCKLTANDLVFEFDDSEMNGIANKLRSQGITTLPDTKVQMLGRCKCDYCGTVNSKDYGTCDYCGAPLPGFKQPVIALEEGPVLCHDCAYYTSWSLAYGRCVKRDKFIGDNDPACAEGRLPKMEDWFR